MCNQRAPARNILIGCRSRTSDLLPQPIQRREPATPRPQGFGLSTLRTWLEGGGVACSARTKELVRNRRGSLKSGRNEAAGGNRCTRAASSSGCRSRRAAEKSQRANLMRPHLGSIWPDRRFENKTVAGPPPSLPQLSQVVATLLRGARTVVESR